MIHKEYPGSFQALHRLACVAMVEHHVRSEKGTHIWSEFEIRFAAVDILVKWVVEVAI